MTKTYDIETTPFEALNKVAAWWQLRPTDKGDGAGYTGMALFVKRFNGSHIEQTEFQGTDLGEMIIDATVWCQGASKTAPQTSKTKRVIPRT
jgi:hypothetical protein